MLDNRARAAMIRKVERKIKSRYRKMCVWCFLIALLMGLVLGFLIARQLFPAQSSSCAENEPVVTATPLPALQGPAQATEAPQLATATPTPMITESPTPVPTPTPSPTVDIPGFFGLSSQDLGIAEETAAPTEAPTPDPTPEATQQAVQVVQTPDPTQANGLLTITPTPAVANVENGLFGGQTTTPTQEEQVTQPVEQDPSAKGGKSNPYLLDEVFTFDTEVLSSGWPRTNTADTSYDTVRLSISLNNYLTPDYFAANYSSKYRLTGTEAGAELTVSVESSTGTAAIMPQNAIDIVFENEAGLEIEGYQIMDAEISGQYEIAIQPGQTQTVYKRFAYNESEDMRYMVVKYYVGGQEYKAYFRLEVAEPDIVYEELTNGSRGDAVQNLQQRLISLGYLDDAADGIFGSNTANAIRAAQEQAGMTSTGVADNEFQQYIYSASAQPAA